MWLRWARWRGTGRWWGGSSLSRLRRGWHVGYCAGGSPQQGAPLTLLCGCLTCKHDRVDCSPSHTHTYGTFTLPVQRAFAFAFTLIVQPAAALGIGIGDGSQLHAQLGLLQCGAAHGGGEPSERAAPPLTHPCFFYPRCPKLLAFASVSPWRPSPISPMPRSPQPQLLLNPPIAAAAPCPGFLLLSRAVGEQHGQH